jgi:hypothetical protein
MIVDDDRGNQLLWASDLGGVFDEASVRRLWTPRFANAIPIHLHPAADVLAPRRSTVLRVFFGRLPPVISSGPVAKPKIIRIAESDTRDLWLRSRRYVRCTRVRS